MSNEKEQFARFCEIVVAPQCEFCPVCIECHEHSLTIDPPQYTCAETLWHYIKTGKLLL